MAELAFEVTHRYRYIEKEEPGNCELYKAQDLLFNRTVALKKVKIEGKSSGEIKKNYNKALDEVRTMVLLPERSAKILNIPNIYESFWDEKEAVLYIIMQWINGRTLAQKLDENISAVKFLGWMCNLCEILNEMAKQNFYHKDIKPQNIMFDKNDRLYLIDFNLTGSLPNTKEGTPYYKAPEMGISDRPNSSRYKVDMFSVGVIMYEYFTRVIPMRGIDYDKFNPAGRSWDFFKEPKEVDPNINDKVNDIIKKLMSYEPKDRYDKYSELIKDLRSAEEEIKKNAGKQRTDRIH